MAETGPPVPGVLYICGTPIGNLDDVTFRLIRTFESVDAILAEDTRRTRKLLSHFNISKPLISYHEHNMLARAPEIIEMLRSGKNLALVSDAGMPGISDPGADLVRVVRQNGFKVVGVPGPSALTAALALSGFRADRFNFMGFLPRKGRNRDAMLGEIARQSGVVVLFEAPHRILQTLEDLENRLEPGREAVIARELTKLHEEVIAGTLAELRRMFAEQDKSRGIRGEMVVVIGAGTGKAKPEKERGPSASDGSEPGMGSESGPRIGTPLEAVEKLIEGGMSTREAVRHVASERGISRRELYREVVRACRQD